MKTKEMTVKPWRTAGPTRPPTGSGVKQKALGAGVTP